MATLKKFNKEEVLNSYLECLLWTNEEMGELTIHDISEELKSSSMVDILVFIANINRTNEAIEEANSYNESELGHNFLLSRNGHGAGFFDDNNDILQNICRNKFKEVDAYVGDDNKIYF